MTATVADSDIIIDFRADEVDCALEREGMTIRWELRRLAGRLISSLVLEREVGRSQDVGSRRYDDEAIMARSSSPP